MSTNCINKSVLALIAAVAISANLSRADEASQPHVDGSQPRPFQNLVTDDAALQAWNNISGKQAEVNCDQEGVPLDEFTRNMDNLFSNQFDIISPSGDRDPNRITMKMRLKDVRAIEIFNAMNLYFEAQDIPAHWRLALNASRPTAILTMKSPIPPRISSALERKHTVFSIGDTLKVSSPANYKQAADKLTEALEAVLDDISDKPRRGPNGEIRDGAPVIKIHAEAGILVFTGTTEETEVVHSTLEAMKDARLRREDALERERKANLEAGPLGVGPRELR
jgi:hypothetical protein